MNDEYVRVSCSREKNTWEDEFAYCNKAINRLCLALQKKNALKLETEFSNDNSVLKFVVTHPDYDTRDEFTLKKLTYQ